MSDSKPADRYKGTSEAQTSRAKSTSDLVARAKGQEGDPGRAMGSADRTASSKVPTAFASSASSGGSLSLGEAQLILSNHEPAPSPSMPAGALDGLMSEGPAQVEPGAIYADSPVHVDHAGTASPLSRLTVALERAEADLRVRDGEPLGPKAGDNPPEGPRGLPSGAKGLPSGAKGLTSGGGTGRQGVPGLPREAGRAASEARTKGAARAPKEGKVTFGRMYTRNIGSGDYGFIGSAQRAKEQMSVYKAVKGAKTRAEAMSALDKAGKLSAKGPDEVFGKGQVKKALAAVDRDYAHRKLADDAGAGKADAEGYDSFGLATARIDRQVKRGAKGAASAAIKGKGVKGVLGSAAIGLADSDTVDTAVNTYRSGKAAVRTAKHLNKRFKSWKAKREAKKAARKAAAKGNDAMRGYAQAKSRLIVKAAKSGRVVVGMSPGQVVKVAANAISSAAASVATAVSTALAPMLVPIIGILVVAVVVSNLFSFLFDWMSQDNVGSLDGIPAQIAATMKGYGFSNEAIAGVLANAEMESSMNPASDENMDGKFNYVYERALGLFQFTYADNFRDPDSDYAAGGTQEYTQFKRWAADNGKSWSDAAVQIDWVFSGEHPEGYYINRWGTNLADAGYYAGDPGYSDTGGQLYRTADEFKGATDAKVAAYSWMACYEKPANGQYSHLDKRLAAADDYLKKLTSDSYSGTTQEYYLASDQQRAIFDAAKQTPSPGNGLCAMWVSQVYSKAGLGYPSGNANDMFWQYCWSTNPSDLKVGMIVAVPTHTRTSAGRVYGHVAIYIGDGMVMENADGINVQSLQSWTDWYGTTYAPRWGFAAGDVKTN